MEPHLTSVKHEMMTSTETRHIEVKLEEHPIKTEYLESDMDYCDNLKGAMVVFRGKNETCDIVDIRDIHSRKKKLQCSYCSKKYERPQLNKELRYSKLYTRY